MFVQLNRKQQTKFALRLTFILMLLGLSYPAMSQDSAFLECASLTDRDERLQCLDRALSEATEAQLENTADVTSEDVRTESVETSTETMDQQPAVNSAVPAVAPVAVQAEDEEQRLQQFGERQARLGVDEEGNEELHDVVVELQKIRDMWRITLSSGQVWVQTYPRRYNLREGDEITISRGGFADAFRLTTERLNGHIRVEKVR